ncbi:MAG: T9SS type A sorting domain-containing protein [Bacteroidetes bacterium]|nr:T9SS type A sorting domain-containing protein [Bacteroidota bacterium]
MKKQLLKKLSAFIIPTISGAMMFSVSANAQIVYTDVNPDSTITCLSSPCTKSYSLDLNNDGISDYNILSIKNNGKCSPNNPLGYSKVYVSVSALNTNTLVAVTNTTYPLAMNFNNVISSGLSLSASGYLRYTSSGCLGYSLLGVWPNLVDRYLGLKLIVGANTYYGWARMQINSDGSTSSCTIKDYAYNTIPNQPIRAGETSCAIPTVSITQSGSLSFCAGDSVTFTANGTGYQYQWKKNNVNIAGATAQTYVAKTAGIYKCKVTNSCGSKGSGTRTVSIPCRLTNEVFTEQLENLYELQIAPNPITNTTSISFTLEQSQKVSLKVVDLNGRLMKVLADNLFEDGEHSIEWRVEDVNSGIYFLQIQTAEYSKTEKLIVTK